MPLSKHDIAEYYSDPHVREAILAQVKNRPVLAVMDRGTQLISRRNAADGKPIRVIQAKGDSNNPQDLAWYTDRRYSEFHPSIGKNTRTAWVDVDPGASVPFKDVKQIALNVAHTLEQMPEVAKTRIAYSGGRGFHVRGDLYRKMPTDTIRKLVQDTVKPLAKGSVVLRTPAKDETRLDTSTLHNKGSLRAEYSLNSETGRVAVPLTERELRNFTPDQADVKRILKEKEFAPGIPRSRRVYPIKETDKGKTWTLVMQEHHADRAGKHWDLRLVDPDTSYAHSWAVPKAKFPGESERLLAVRTPTHTAHYALNFGAKGPQQIGKGYGKGSVQIVAKEPVQIEKVTENTVKFKRLSSGTSYTMFRTNGDSWLFQQGKGMEKQAYVLGYRATMCKFGLDATGPAQEADTEAVEGLLSSLQEFDTPQVPEDDASPMVGQSASERRLNQPVTWAAPVSSMGLGQNYDNFRGRSYG